MAKTYLRLNSPGRLGIISLEKDWFYIIRAEDSSGRLKRRHTVVFTSDAPAMMAGSSDVRGELVTGDLRERVLNKYMRGQYRTSR